MASLAASLPLDLLRYRWTLVSIPFSHFNERARWALDLAAVSYRTVRVLPLFNMPVVALYHRWYGHVGKRDRVSSPYSTPLLIGDATRSGQAQVRPVVVDDSADIVALLDRERKLGLFPPDQAEAIRAIEKVFHDDLGPAARVVDYQYLLPSWSLSARIMFHNAGILQATLFMLFFPLIRAAIRTGLRVSESRMRTGLEKIRAVFAQVSSILEANAALYQTDTPYICGPTFTAADLTFSALGAIVIGINHKDGFGAWMPDMADLPAPLRKEQESLRATPAGQHIVRMYQQHRLPHRA